MSHSEGMPAEYPVGENELQTRRLITQAQLYDPSTRAFFAAAGIGRGMKVLELGSGVGDVTLLLAERVGPSGRVVGVELVPAAAEAARARIAAAGWRNVTYVAGDVSSVTLDEDFDAVAGRFVLMWLPDPLAVLQRVVACLRPGGIVAFQDNDFTFTVHSSPELPLFSKVRDLMQGAQGRGGPNFHMGLKMPGLYHEAGLPAPQLTLDAPIGTGLNWTGYQFMAETLEMLLPMMRQLGVALPDGVDPSTLAEQVRREAVENRASIVLPAIIGAWSRKPG